MLWGRLPYRAEHRSESECVILSGALRAESNLEGVHREAWRHLLPSRDLAGSPPKPSGDTPRVKVLCHPERSATRGVEPRGRAPTRRGGTCCRHGILRGLHQSRAATRRESVKAKRAKMQRRSSFYIRRLPPYPPSRRGATVTSAFGNSRSYLTARALGREVTKSLPCVRGGGIFGENDGGVVPLP